MVAVTRAKAVATAKPKNALAAAPLLPSPSATPSSSKRRSHQPDSHDTSRPPLKKIKLPPKYSKSKSASTTKITVTNDSPPAVVAVAPIATTPDPVSTMATNVTETPGTPAIPSTDIEDPLALDNAFAEQSSAAKADEVATENDLPDLSVNPFDDLNIRERLANSVSKDLVQAVPFDGRGLSNFTGSLCYRHSLFQALFHWPQFVNWLRDGYDPAAGGCVADNPAECVSCCLRDLATKYWNHKTTSKEFTSQLKVVDEVFKKNGWAADNMHGHADPEEQMTWMMEKISQEFPMAQFAQYLSFKQLKLQSSIVCGHGKCPKISTSGSDFVDSLQVPIKPRVKRDRLEGLIENYFDEMIQGYICEACKVKESRHRVQKIAFAPNFLTVTLKRFDYDETKDNDKVKYSEELDLSKHRADSTRGALTYHLKAVISHQGSLKYGHYLCVARTPTGDWCCFDDHTIYESELAEALDPACYQKTGKRKTPWTPYVLFYERDGNSLP